MGEIALSNGDTSLLSNWSLNVSASGRTAREWSDGSRIMMERVARLGFNRDGRTIQLASRVWSDSIGRRRRHQRHALAEYDSEWHLAASEAADFDAMCHPTHIPAHVHLPNRDALPVVDRPDGLCIDRIWSPLENDLSSVKQNYRRDLQATSTMEKGVREAKRDKISGWLPPLGPSKQPQQRPPNKKHRGYPRFDEEAAECALSYLGTFPGLALWPTECMSITKASSRG